VATPRSRCCHPAPPSAGRRRSPPGQYRACEAPPPCPGAVLARTFGPPPARYTPLLYQTFVTTPSPLLSGPPSRCAVAGMKALTKLVKPSERAERARSPRPPPRSESVGHDSSWCGIKLLTRCVKLLPGRVTWLSHQWGDSQALRSDGFRIRLSLSGRTRAACAARVSLNTRR